MQSRSMAAIVLVNSVVLENSTIVMFSMFHERTHI